MARVLGSIELATQRSQRQWSKAYLAIPEYHTVYSARLDGVPTDNDMVAEIDFIDGVGDISDVLPDMTLYVGTTAGAYDLGMCRIRKAPLESCEDGTFYIAETSDVVWVDQCYLTVVDDYQIWAKPLRIVSSTPYMDWDIAYSDQHANFDPVPVMGCDAVAKLVDGQAIVTLGPSDDTDAWVIGSTISSVLWSIEGAVSIDDNTSVNTFATFDTAGTYLAYCQFTAANGKTFTGVRTIIIWDDANPLLTNFQIRGGRMSYDGGGCSFNVTLFSGFSKTDLRVRSKVILCTEDFAENSQITLPGQITGRENILCIGWITDIDTSRSSEFGEVSFTVESAEFWMKKIRDYPSGLEFKIGTAAAWTDMPSLTVDRALWHFIHWRSTMTRVMDVTLTGDTRMATRFNIMRANLWERMEQVAKPTIFASAGVDNFGRLFISIEPQMVPEADRTWPQVMTITDSDLEDGISWTRRDVNNLSMLFLSGISVDASKAPSSFFSMSPGHSYARLGDEEAQDNYLVASQANSNQLCGLYYGWRNNDPFDLSVNFTHSMRVLGIWPRQKYYLVVSPANDPRGIGIDEKFIVREIGFEVDAETGFISINAALEPEAVEGPSINGDVPTMEDTDFSIPDLGDFPSLPALPYIPLPPTEEPTNEPTDVLIWGQTGVYYTKTFNASSPTWLGMNNGLTAGQIADIQNIVVTPGGSVYLHTRHAEVMAADALGGTWREVLSYADFPIYTYDYRKIMGIGINPLASDQIAVYGGQVWLISPLHYGMMYLTVGNKDGFGSFNQMVEGHYFEASVQYGNGGWLVFHAGISGILGGTPYPRVAQFSAGGVYSDIADIPDGWGPASQFSTQIGTSDKSIYWHDNPIQSQYIDFVGIDTQTINSALAPRNRQSVAMSPTGTHGMGSSGGTYVPYKTTNSGATWTSAAGTIAIGSDVWENCRDNFRWIFGGGVVLNLTMDQGATYTAKNGNLFQISPSLDVAGIRYIQ